MSADSEKTRKFHRTQELLHLLHHDREGLLREYQNVAENLTQPLHTTARHMVDEILATEFPPDADSDSETDEA